MPSISLRKQPGMYLTHSGLVIVHDLPLPSSNLFKRYRHKPLSSFRPDNIYLYEGSFTFMNFWGNRTNLQITNEYSTVPLKYADIYFNKFDKSNTPLLCVLKFHNKKDGKTVQDRIYLHSRDVYLINQSSYTNITTLSSFDASNEKELLDLLLKETNTLLKTIIYDVDKKNTQTHPISYGPDEITLSAKQGVNYDSFNMFSKYIHKPKNRRPKSFVLYNNNAPMVDNNTFLPNIQQEPHDSITVYFSNELDTPLVIESIKNGKKSHFQRISSDGIRWIRNDIDDYTDQELVSYLGTVYRFVKGKKEEEQQRRDREQRMKPTPERKRTPTPKRVGEPESISTQRTEEQEAHTTTTRQETQESTSSTSAEFQADDHVTYSPQPKPTLTCNMCVLLDKQEQYKSPIVKKTCTPEKPSETQSEPVDLQPSNVSVLPFDLRDVVGNKTGYKYYIHDIKPDLDSLKKQTQDKNIVIELTIYISKIDIFLYDTNGIKTTLIYNLDISKNSLYVYFYEHNTKPQKTDTVPLMFYFNGDFYGPSDRGNYFTGWNWIDGISGISDESGIKKKLDTINRELNRIELSNKGGDKCSYGIPKFFKPEIQKFETDRVKVTVQKKENYTRVIHRTINSFTIGDIYYGAEDISKGTITIKGTIGRTGSYTITFDKTKNHTKFVTDHNPNTVVAYYSSEDNKYTIPQLIVLLHTANPIDKSADTPITASTTNNKYGYYVLATGEGAGSYKYEWRSVEDSQANGFKLDLETEYSLLNSIIILVEKQSEYKEEHICKAVQSADSVRSPGNTTGVNRLKGKDINVSDQTGSRAVYYGDPGKCVKKYGYRLWAHDLSASTSKIFGIDPILGIRFIMPSSDTRDKYDEISLHQNDPPKGQVDRLYHISTANKVYVYFYGSDPRPLLLCYEKNAYKPRKTAEPIKERQVMVEYTQWVKVEGVSKCTCQNGAKTGQNEPLLKSLTEVVGFLNPVQINPKEIPPSESGEITKDEKPTELPKHSIYNIHKFTHDKTVQMKITRTNISCYEQYKYEPYGTGGTRGEGFRLGSVHYCDSKYSNKFNRLEYNTLTSQYRHYPLVKATVYYYDHDKQFKEPLLIELEFNTNAGVGPTVNPKEYYRLETLINSGGTGMTWAKDPGANEQLSSDPDNQKLVNYLDSIRYDFKNLLQVCVAHKQAKPYTAKLLDRNSGTPVEPKEEIQVTVSEEQDCQSLTKTGFRCFKHQITKLGSKELHKIGALLFFIPDKDSAGLVKLNLYDTQSTGLVPIQPLYYNCGMGDIYVYFYGGNDNGGTHIVGDPRPLLLCYNNSGYKAWNINTYDNHIWLKSNEIKDCTCKSGDNKLLEKLVKVCNFLNPVYINRTVGGGYRVHRFNGDYIYNNLKAHISKSSFCYNKFVHSPKPGYRLGRIDIDQNKQCIYESTGVTDSEKCINSVLDNPPNKYTPASEVVVYYYKGDKMYRNPLLVVLCNKMYQYVVASTTTPRTCRPYYELQRETDTTTNKKVYIKEITKLNLNPIKGGQLEKLLDKILFYISKSLQINLSFRAKTTVVKPIFQSKKQTITIVKDKYSANVYENIEYKPKPFSTTTSIDVQVTGPTDIINDKKQKTGYQCYQHRLTSISDNEQIGGLRLFLWDNRGKGEEDKEDCKVTGPTTQPNHLTKRSCCEIKLYEKCNQTGGRSSDQPIEQIAYTTCKGDLYVYFYGSDPRPLLLCYNGQAYKPNELISI